VVKVSAAQVPPDGGDDRIFTTRDAVIMLDGASACAPVPVPAARYAEQIGRYLAGHLDDGGDLRGVLADAISHTARALDVRPGESPSSTVTILRRAGSYIECLVLGDNLVVLPGCTITDDRLARLGQAERQRYHAHLRDGHGYDARLRQLLAALQSEQARRRNQPGGYWIAEADPEAARHARMLRRPAAGLRWAVLATDGAYKTLTHLGLADWPALRSASSTDLTQLLERCQSWESDEDPGGQKLPRAKRHDDKSLAVLTFAA
jgi:hypothetical protein